MKKISNLNVDVWKETEVCVYEDEKTLMFLAPCQAWVGNALKELEEAGIYPAGHTAVMKRDDQIVLGYINTAEGIIQFRKADRNTGQMSSRLCWEKMTPGCWASC